MEREMTETPVSETAEFVKRLTTIENELYFARNFDKVHNQHVDKAIDGLKKLNNDLVKFMKSLA